MFSDDFLNRENITFLMMRRPSRYEKRCDIRHALRYVSRQSKKLSKEVSIEEIDREEFP
jgi:hypothetical protein